MVTAIHSRMADPGSVAKSIADVGPTVDSLTVCQMKTATATRSRDASHTWPLSAGERERNLGSPNSAYNGKGEQ